MDKASDTDQIAAEWVTRSSRGLDPAERNELLAWQAADPRNLGSYLRACAIDRIARSLTMEDLAHSQTSQSAAADTAHPRLFGRRRMIGMALAASVAAAFGVGLFPREVVDRRASQPGQVRKLALTDGSVAALSVDTKIAVEMTSSRRTVELETGKAWFHVAHNPDRPFEVRHDDIIVRATGTAFQVKTLEHGVEVIVTEGSVAVLRWDRPIARLQAGSRLTYGADIAHKETLTAAAISRETVWREGLIFLDGQRVADAIAALNRQNATQIRLVDPALADRQVYGTYRVDRPEQFAKALGVALNAKVMLGDGYIAVGGRP